MLKPCVAMQGFDEEAQMEEQNPGHQEYSPFLNHDGVEEGRHLIRKSGTVRLLPAAKTVADMEPPRRRSHSSLLLHVAYGLEAFGLKLNGMHLTRNGESFCVGEHQEKPKEALPLDGTCHVGDQEIDDLSPAWLYNIAQGFDIRGD